MEQSDANSSGHSCPACHLAEPAINAAKRRPLPENLRFAGFLYSRCHYVWTGPRKYQTCWRVWRKHQNSDTAFVLDIHNRVGRTPHKLCKVFLRPASFLAGVFYRQPENQTYLHNVPYNITQTYFIFKVIVCELNTILWLVVFNCRFSKNTHLTYVWHCVTL